MKDKAFARGVKREDLRAGAELLGLPLEEHIANVIGFMREQRRRARAAGHAVSAADRLQAGPFRSAGPYINTAWLSPIRSSRSTTSPSPTASSVALRDVTASFAAGAVGLLGPERRRQEHDDQGAARVHRARPRGRMRVLGLDVADVAARDPRARRLHAGERRAHSRA